MKCTFLYKGKHQLIGYRIIVICIFDIYRSSFTAGFKFSSLCVNTFECGRTNPGRCFSINTKFLQEAINSFTNFNPVRIFLYCQTGTSRRLPPFRTGLCILYRSILPGGLHLCPIGIVLDIRGFTRFRVGILSGLHHGGDDIVFDQSVGKHLRCRVVTFENDLGTFDIGTSVLHRRNERGECAAVLDIVFKEIH